jgi:hypothetical protein
MPGRTRIDGEVVGIAALPIHAELSLVARSSETLPGDSILAAFS